MVSDNNKAAIDLFLGIESTSYKHNRFLKYLSFLFSNNSNLVLLWWKNCFPLNFSLLRISVNVPPFLLPCQDVGIWPRQVSMFFSEIWLLFRVLENLKSLQMNYWPPFSTKNVYQFLLRRLLELPRFLCSSVSLLSFLFGLSLSKFPSAPHDQSQFILQWNGLICITWW